MLKMSIQEEEKLLMKWMLNKKSVTDDELAFLVIRTLAHSKVSGVPEELLNPLKKGLAELIKDTDERGITVVALSATEYEWFETKKVQ